MTTQFRFLDWKVYDDSQKLFSLVLSVVRDLPREYCFEMGNQIIRSSLSISLNIAEGSGKHSEKEFCRFVDIALGSAYETLACTDALYRNKFIEKNVFDQILKIIEEICRQLGGLKKKTKNSSQS